MKQAVRRSLSRMEDFFLLVIQGTMMHKLPAPPPENPVVAAINSNVFLFDGMLLWVFGGVAVESAARVRFNTE
jgi:hypothetical protein